MVPQRPTQGMHLKQPRWSNHLLLAGDQSNCGCCWAFAGQRAREWGRERGREREGERKRGGEGERERGREEGRERGREGERREGERERGKKQGVWGVTRGQFTSWCCQSFGRAFGLACWAVALVALQVARALQLWELQPSHWWPMPSCR